MSPVWLVLTAVGLYVQKAVGVAIPATVLERAWIQRVLALLPVALLAALTAVQTVSSPEGPVVDARLAGVSAAGVALALRAPFLVVIVVAAATAAGLRSIS